MKKKILALCLVICLAATAIIGGTLAYFTDTDAETNVMTTGKVSIVQNEKERSENGELQDFKDNKILLPAVGDNNKDGKLDVAYDDAENHLFSNDRNVVDKMISVTNDGNQDAYVRTLIAFELPVAPEGFQGATLNDKYVDVVNVRPYLTTVMCSSLYNNGGYGLPMDGENYIIVTVNDVAYLVTDYYYQTNSDANATTKDSSLAPNATTHDSLKQIYLAANATNEDAALLVGADGNYNILALSQGVQKAGFSDAKSAMDAAFGELNTENAQKWFSGAFEAAE